jgi:exodeoxyribonuclease VII small subunit
MMRIHSGNHRQKLVHRATKRKRARLRKLMLTCRHPERSRGRTVWKVALLLSLCLIGCRQMALKTENAELSFEKAMERLEAIVEEMESGKMPLEDLLVRYEEGMKLVKVCQERLSCAEEKIEIITRDHAGKVAVKNFEVAEVAGAGSASHSITKEKNDDVSLF